MLRIELGRVVCTYENGLANYTSSSAYPNGYVSGSSAGDSHYAGAVFGDGNVVSIPTAGSTGFVFYIKTQNVGAINIQLNWGRVGSISLYDINAENPTWVKSTGANVAYTWRSFANIPANFEGYVYVSYEDILAYGDWSSIPETITLIHCHLLQVGGDYDTFSMGSIYTTADTVVNGTTAGVVLPEIENPTATFEKLEMQDVAGYGNFVSNEPWDTTKTIMLLYH